MNLFQVDLIFRLNKQQGCRKPSIPGYVALDRKPDGLGILVFLTLRDAARSAVPRLLRP
jgi:hypothetical protein